MNLSPEWSAVLRAHRFSPCHWQDVGEPTATDPEILRWALQNDHVVFTNDLDFGRLLALAYSRGPSVFQIRGTLLLPEDAEELVVTALNHCHEELREGALVTVDAGSWRVRTLPIK